MKKGHTIYPVDQFFQTRYLSLYTGLRHRIIILDNSGLSMNAYFNINMHDIRACGYLYAIKQLCQAPETICFDLTVGLPRDLFKICIFKIRRFY